MKTELQRRYDAIENDGFYTFLDGTRVETDEIAVYGIESSPHTLETDPDSCEIGTMLVKEAGADWRDATEDELTEINDDREYMEDLVWGIVKDLTE